MDKHSKSPMKLTSSHLVCVCSNNIGIQHHAHVLLLSVYYCVHVLLCTCITVYMYYCVHVLLCTCITVCMYYCVRVVLCPCITVVVKLMIKSYYVNDILLYILP